MDIVVNYFLQLENIVINATDHWGNTALHIAIRHRHIEIIKLLLEYGIDFNVLNNDGMTPLHLATSYSYEEVVNVLVHQSGIDINIGDHSGSTPLQYMCNIVRHFRRYSDILDTLIENSSTELF